jgi:hypothetical protein
MPVPLEFEIADELSKCIDGRYSLEEFRQWFVPTSLDIEASGNQAAIDLAYRIDGILAEASSANWKDDDIVEELAHIPLVPVGENRNTG